MHVVMVLQVVCSIWVNDSDVGLIPKLVTLISDPQILA